MTNANQSEPSAEIPSKKSLPLILLVSLFVLILLCVIFSIVLVLGISPFQKQAVDPTVIEDLSPTSAPTATEAVVPSPTTNPYQGWTAKQTEMGISLMHPENFSVSEDENATQIFSFFEEMENDIQAISITIYKSDPWNQEDYAMFESQNIRTEEEDRTIVINDKPYKAMSYFSAEGSPGPEEGHFWGGIWTTEVIELPGYIVFSIVAKEEITDAEENVLSSNSPTEQQLLQKDQILASLKF